MKNIPLRYRWLLRRLPAPDKRRIVVITGARQTGKTTLARLKYPGLKYINLDSVEEREAVSAIRTSAWSKAVGEAVIDEAQKGPGVFEKVKWAFDQGEINFSVLTGSSRILLMSGVRETMAGRAFLYDLWPLMASEFLYSMDDDPNYPLIHQLIEGKAGINRILLKSLKNPHGKAFRNPQLVA